jgi:hypothetical protein
VAVAVKNRLDMDEVRCVNVVWSSKVYGISVESGKSEVEQHRDGKEGKGR